MKLTFNRPCEMEVDAVRCVMEVRYDEEDMPNDYPHRKGDTWDITIDLATGQIRDWPKGVEPRDIYMKVCDCGSYYLLNKSAVVASIEENYVPNELIPGEYGDYIDFKIDAKGVITNWPKRPVNDDFKAFFTTDDD